MRILSLNLDVEDAAAIRRALAVTMTACACADGADGADGRGCADCEAIGAVVADIDRLLTRPTPRRAVPLMPGLPTSAFAASDFAAATVGGGRLDTITAPTTSGIASPRHLWVVPGGAADPR